MAEICIEDESEEFTGFDTDEEDKERQEEFSDDENMATVTIVGTGNMARGLTARLAAGGHDVEIVGHSTEQAEQFVAQLADTGVSSTTLEAANGDIVILAIWYAAARDVVSEHADRLAGRVLVDITNPVDTATFDGLVTPAGSSPC